MIGYSLDLELTCHSTYVLDLELQVTHHIFYNYSFPYVPLFCDVLGPYLLLILDRCPKPFFPYDL